MKGSFMKIINRILVTVSAFTLVAGSVFAPDSFAQDPDFYIFLAFGQSNMDGAGKIEDQDRKVNSRFKVMYAADNDGNRRKGTWATAVPPLCRGSSSLCPADYFGRTLVDSLPSNIKIGIINVSIPGTKIELFVKDSYQSYLSGLSSGDQYIKNISNTSYGGNPSGRLIEMAKLAQKDGVIKGFLMHQGESNPNDNQWTRKVKSIYDNFITELGLNASETPLLAGELLYKNQKGACGAFNAQYIDTLYKVIPNAHAISADSLEGVDSFHFTSASYRKFGKRYADTMLTILKNQATSVAEGKKAIYGSKMERNLKMNVYGNSITFEIPEQRYVTLKAYTLQGNLISTIAGSRFSAGEHTLTFNQNKVPSGVFLLRLDAEGSVATRTIIARQR